VLLLKIQTFTPMMPAVVMASAVPYRRPRVGVQGHAPSRFHSPRRALGAVDAPETMTLMPSAPTRSCAPWRDAWRGDGDALLELDRDRLRDEAAIQLGVLISMTLT